MEAKSHEFDVRHAEFRLKQLDEIDAPGIEAASGVLWGADIYTVIDALLGAPTPAPSTSHWSVAEPQQQAPPSAAASQEARRIEQQSRELELARLRHNASAAATPRETELDRRIRELEEAYRRNTEQCNALRRDVAEELRTFRMLDNGVIRACSLIDSSAESAVDALRTVEGMHPMLEIGKHSGFRKTKNKAATELCSMLRNGPLLVTTTAAD